MDTETSYWEKRVISRRTALRLLGATGLTAATLGSTARGMVEATRCGKTVTRYEDEVKELRASLHQQNKTLSDLFAVIEEQRGVIKAQAETIKIQGVTIDYLRKEKVITQ